MFTVYLQERVTNTFFSMSCNLKCLFLITVACSLWPGILSLCLTFCLEQTKMTPCLEKITNRLASSIHSNGTVTPPDGRYQQKLRWKKNCKSLYKDFLVFNFVRSINESLTMRKGRLERTGHLCRERAGGGGGAATTPPGHHAIMPLRPLVMSLYRTNRAFSGQI